MASKVSVFLHWHLLLDFLTDFLCLVKDVCFAEDLARNFDGFDNIGNHCAGCGAVEFSFGAKRQRRTGIEMSRSPDMVNYVREYRQRF
jgi:hypothetical protein